MTTRLAIAALLMVCIYLVTGCAPRARVVVAMDSIPFWEAAEHLDK